MTPDQFIEKWRASTLKERSASQSHFIDLCKVLGVENPTDADQQGDTYCFERGASKTAGGEGWADVWKRSCFGWEYKGKRKDLKAAFAQLQQYAVALENPPLLVVSDMETIEVHTNWTNTVSEVHRLTLDDLRDSGKRDFLRAVFLEPERLKPKKTIDALTREVADKFAGLAQRLRDDGHDPQVVAHFVNRLVFCMFAEDISFLPRNIFSQILDRSVTKPEIATDMLRQLFAAMRSGGLFGVDEIEWFNGGLFDDDTTLPLTRTEIKIIGEAAAFDWSDIDPSIFGTLFERGLDPAKRSQLGAHYTDAEKIMMIVRPVVIEPLWREWEGVKAEIQKPRTSEKKKQELHYRFLERLKNFRVLDPACGSGNFLYLALLALKDIEHRVNLDAEALGLGRQFPSVGPEAVMGIELNPYAAELARVTIWIGEIQWMRKNGFDVSRKPILKPLNNIENRDAILNEDGTEAQWPKADAIIGNPPFLGGGRISSELGTDEYRRLSTVFAGRLSGFADLVCYWFEKAFQQLSKDLATRVGLVATNSISGGKNREILQKIIEHHHIYDAYSDEPWTVDGASVRVAIVCFTQKNRETLSKLNSRLVHDIFSDLEARVDNSGSDLTKAEKLTMNEGVSFLGTKKGGPFDLPADVARSFLGAPTNPNGKRNAEVIFRRVTGGDIAARPEDRWIIDFGVSITKEEAMLFELPFEYVLKHVKPVRDTNKRAWRREKFWLHSEPAPGYKSAINKLSRYIASPRVSKYRTFVWLGIGTSLDDGAIAIARDDDTSFGILHSRFHEMWSLRLCTYLGVGNDPRYTPSTTFETFPFPAGLEPNRKPANYDNPHAQAIADAAKRLNELRENWLNPPDLVKRVPEVVAGYPDRIEPVGVAARAELKKRTLTNLYNARPAWLANAHADLDAAVAAAYGWPTALSDDEILKRLLELNLSRAETKKTSDALL